MPLSSPNASGTADPATMAAPSASPPSMPSQARVIQDSARSMRARRTHSADSRLGAAARPAATNANAGYAAADDTLPTEPFYSNTLEEALRERTCPRIAVNRATVGRREPVPAIAAPPADWRLPFQQA
jgi:hypothetical protein